MSLNFRWLQKILKRLLKRGDRRIPLPTAEQISLLPWFEGLTPPAIVVVSSKEGAHRAYQELASEKLAGFDTESKPTFAKGEKSKGPHVVQFATLSRAFIFMLHDPDCQEAASRLIRLPSLKKVGFGLADDLKRIRGKLQVEPRGVLDLEKLFAARGHGRNVGVKLAVAIALQKQFKKSRKTASSNWGAHHLTDRQLLYAANDAFAALKAFLALTANDPA